MLRRCLIVSLSLANVLGLAGCTGKVLGDATLPGPMNPANLKVGITGAHRLSANEYDNTLKDLLQDNTLSGFATLPQDAADPFDNDYTTQQASGALVDGAETLAINAAQRAVANPAVMSAILPCAPQGPSDTACLTQFIQTFGRRVLRRPLTSDEVTGYASLQSFAVEANDFKVGVQLVIQAMLQDLSFLYRTEVGTPVPNMPGVYRLNDFEVASRMSFFLWGSTPPDWLLDQAQQGQLELPDGLRATANKLLADPRSRTRVERFHALWLGYAQLPHAAALNAAMETESAALLDKVIFDQPSDYFDVFESKQTYINALLSTQYGLPAPTAPDGNGFGWVAYGATPRKGILSHGTVLSQGAKFGDTSPTRRGVFVRTRLLCQTVPPPPPTVNVDNPPTSTNGSPCKVDKYSSHASVGSCAACHTNLDPIGFGLENFDENGVYRTTDNGLPQCPIAGNGTVAGLGTFNGPAGLADVLTASGQLEQCVSTQLFRFALGRRETPDDTELIGTLAKGFQTDGRHFSQMLVELVADPSFSYRKDQ